MYILSDNHASAHKLLFISQSMTTLAQTITSHDLACENIKWRKQIDESATTLFNLKYIDSGKDKNTLSVTTGHGINPGDALGIISLPLIHSSTDIVQVGNNNPGIIAGEVWRSSPGFSFSTTPYAGFVDHEWMYKCLADPPPSNQRIECIAVSAAELWRHWQVHGDRQEAEFNTRQTCIRLFFEQQSQRWNVEESLLDFNMALLEYIPTAGNGHEPVCVCVATNKKEAQNEALQYDIVIDQSETQSLAVKPNRPVWPHKQFPVYTFLFEDLYNSITHSAPKDRLVLFNKLTEKFDAMLDSIQAPSRKENLTWSGFYIEVGPNDKWGLNYGDNCNFTMCSYMFPLHDLCLEFNNTDKNDWSHKNSVCLLALVFRSVTKYISNYVLFKKTDPPTQTYEEPRLNLPKTNTILKDITKEKLGTPDYIQMSYDVDYIVSELISYSTASKRSMIRGALRGNRNYPAYAVFSELSESVTSIWDTIARLRNRLQRTFHTETS